MEDRELFLSLIRLGIGQATTNNSLASTIDWGTIQALANEQGLSAIVLDGVEKLSEESRPSKEALLQWIGEVLQLESQHAVQQKASADMALLFHNNGIRTYVLKGAIIAECYPNPKHRYSVDLDCFLLPQKGTYDAWSFGNDLIKAQGLEVRFDYYKNSTLILPGLTVENHQYLVPFRGNKKLRNLEITLQALLKNDDGGDIIEGTNLHRPPVMVSSLFLIEHAYSHFLSEGLTWRLVLDWVMFRQKHYKQINWSTLDALIDEFGFRKFYDSYNHLGQYLIGEVSHDDLTNKDRIMLDDVWAPLDLHETVEGIKGKLIEAGNTWRARKKYRYFGDISMLHALWIQVKGYLFIKHPTL